MIVAINDQPVTSFDDLLVYIALQSAPGDEVRLRVLRQGDYVDLVVRLEERPASLNLYPSTVGAFEKPWQLAQPADRSIRADGVGMGAVGRCIGIAGNQDTEQACILRPQDIRTQRVAHHDSLR